MDSEVGNEEFTNFWVLISLDLECPSRVHMLKDWSPACATIGR
jgi:hypothetical protein